MSTSRRASVSETTSLLEDSPPSYHSTDDVDEAVPEPEADSDPQPLNVFSRRDTCWILAGLWSAVLLGAFDGKNGCRYVADAHWKRVQSFKPIVIYRDFILIIRRLADILGRKGAMLLALTLFGSGTILCGMAPSMTSLIVARAVAGMGGGGVMTAKVNIKLPSEIQNQPLSEKLQRVDVMGSITLVVAVGFLLLGFSLKTTEEMPWSHPLITSLLGFSVIFGIGFVYVEKHWAPYPVMPLRMMTQRTPLAVAISNLLTSMTAFSMLYNIPLYFSAVRLEPAAKAGCDFHWKRLCRVDHETHRKTLYTNSGFITAYYSREHAFPQGFGMASFITSTLIAMIAGVYREDMAVATGITYLFRTTGQVLGVSLSGAILQGVLVQRLRIRISGPDADQIIYKIQHSTELIPTLDPLTRQAAVDSYADALHVVFICQVAINICGLLACLPIQENALPSTPPTQVRQNSENEEN
ncbi:hypothetical protein NP233_g7272 [Leucocoprinus birnbaumii]|uniref:Uncharacterized protein n=1 Tax=Leucocoprinus birnbaumii TaxID=56174 RepID=A0AAD5VPK2_9AGAR|nr:hypothetical protein NP233_g7272 [Leucocoprinus birnbaumii]